MDIRGDEIQPMDNPKTFLLTYLLLVANFATLLSRRETATKRPRSTYVQVSSYSFTMCLL